MADISTLLEIMQRLRDPEGGCPWDRQQTPRTLIPYTIEEAYEVADAIERDDVADLQSELGDLLFQVVFYAQIASEKQQFDFQDVVDAICDKLVRRHPHVFAGAEVADAESQTREWEKHKQREREAKSDQRSQPASQMDDISRTLPAIMRAEKLQRRAARVGFDWPDVQGVVEKLQEELDELQEAMAEQGKQDQEQAIEEEAGDLLFTCINLTRHLGVNAETALREANNKFEKRFRQMETGLSVQGLNIQEVEPAMMNQVWDENKKRD